jgi:tetratricopeptide (TPR) repeat protein
MDCPRCGATAVETPECPGCGVVLAKARPARPRPEQASSSSDPNHAAAWRSLALPALGLVVLTGAAVVYLRQPERGTRAPARPEGTVAVTTPPVYVRPPDPALPAPELPTFARVDSNAADRTADADQATAERLLAQLGPPARVTPEDLRAAEDLYARHPAEARDLLEAILLAFATGQRHERRLDAAATLIERAVTIAPQSAPARRALLGVLLEAGQWAAAEQAGRGLVALQPDDAEALRGVAYALVRQDRMREATDLLTAFLQTHDDAETRAFLARLLHDQAPEKSLEEARLAHFHVRYDGEAHEEVGREILRLAERHYATLARSFDYEPAEPIPVVLLSRTGYYDATGAPAWSGGQYDGFDGRVRIPIRGLSGSLAPDLDDTLIHEITHAFVADLTRGKASHELQEGLAQYMEGKRTGQIDAQRLRALADGRLGGVSGFYFGALSLVEDLFAQRGQGGINDLLRALATARSNDEAFRSVYGQDFATLKRQWAERLRLRYGS